MKKSKINLKELNKEDINIIESKITKDSKNIKNKYKDLDTEK